MFIMKRQITLEVDNKQWSPTPEDLLLLRTKLGISQQAMAEKLGVSIQSIFLWERRGRMPSRMALRLLRPFFEAQGMVWKSE